MHFYNRLRKILNEPVYQVAVLVFLFEAAFVPKTSQLTDTQTYCSWANYIIAHGIGNIYTLKEPVCNYPPVIAYILFLYAKLVHLNGCQYFTYFKLVALLADFAVAILLVKMLNIKAKEIALLLFLIVNPFFIYNSYCWGQVDGILALFVFLSFIFIRKGKLFWSVFFFTLAINFKVHAIIFFPPLVLLAYYTRANEIRIGDILISILVFLATEALIFLPFIIDGQIANAVKSFTGSVDFFEYISFNAYNIWRLFSAKLGTSDKIKWMGLSYQQWGLGMFFLSSAIALFPLFISCVSKRLKKSIYTIDIPSLFLVFALISLLFFYLNTQMHERFAHSSLVFVAAFSFSTRKYWLFLLVCVVYFCNMENVLHFFEFSNYDLPIFSPLWISWAYLFLIISLFYFLYKPFILQLKMNRYAKIQQAT